MQEHLGDLVWGKLVRFVNKKITDVHLSLYLHVYIFVSIVKHYDMVLNIGLCFNTKGEQRMRAFATTPCKASLCSDGTTVLILPVANFFLADLQR